MLRTKKRTTRNPLAEVSTAPARPSRVRMMRLKKSTIAFSVLAARKAGLGALRGDRDECGRPVPAEGPRGLSPEGEGES